jgi:hypothetical protein
VNCPGKAFRQRHRRTESEALDLVSLRRRDSAGKLEAAGNESISSRGEIIHSRHVVISLARPSRGLDETPKFTIVQSAGSPARFDTAARVRTVPADAIAGV